MTSLTLFYRDQLVPSDEQIVSAVIPAYNEKERIEEVINETKHFVDEVIVIDDFSSDGTGELAVQAGAKVITNQKNIGYIKSIKKGFRKAKGDIVITLDGDGEHSPSEILRLLKPIQEGRADLVLGKREKITRISELFLNWLTKFKVKIEDTGTGFRAIKKDLALKLELKGKCTCGVLVLEANSKGAKITEVPITINPVDKKRRIVWRHFLQFFYILEWLLK